MSTAISFDPDAAANALLGEQHERERVVRDLAASYGDVLHREHELETARAAHLQLRARAAEFGITDTALKKAGIPTVTATPRRTGPARRAPRRAAAQAPTTATSENTIPAANPTENHDS